ncbi:MAG: 1,3-beta-galactosyl-N-acetylhexosamine phosphorylase N-terminal domain-containing protein [Flavonifractor plautii]
MDETRRSGRVTIPTDLDVVPETLEILKKWGADAIRDCDGTDFPQQLKDADAKIYSTYYTTRKDNAWARQTGRGTAVLHRDDRHTPPPATP